MHPGFRQSVPYMAHKQEQCVSDITELTPANSFLNFNRYGIKRHSGVLVPKVTWSMGDMDLPHIHIYVHYVTWSHVALGTVSLEHILTF